MPRLAYARRCTSAELLGPSELSSPFSFSIHPIFPSFSFLFFHLYASVFLSSRNRSFRSRKGRDVGGGIVLTSAAVGRRRGSLNDAQWLRISKTHCGTSLSSMGIHQNQMKKKQGFPSCTYLFRSVSLYAICISPLPSSGMGCFVSFFPFYRARFYLFYFIFWVF